MSLQKRTIKMGTTTACYFASLYADACTILAKKTAELGQRAFIGKVNMNIPRDDGYCESTLTSVVDTIGFIKSIEIIGVNANLYFIANSSIIDRQFYVTINHRKILHCSKLVAESTCKADYYTKIRTEL